MQQLTAISGCGVNGEVDEVRGDRLGEVAMRPSVVPAAQESRRQRRC